MFESLPSLCLDIIAAHACRQYGDTWTSSDVARDIAALSCASQRTRELAHKMVEIVDPTNDYDTFLKEDAKTTVVQLKKTCKKNKLQCSGTKQVLIDRLRMSLGRCPSNRMSNALILSAKNKKIFNITGLQMLLTPMGLSYTTIDIPFVFPMSRNTLFRHVMAKFGSPCILYENQQLKLQKIKAQENERRATLVKALAQKQLKLRYDSIVCEMYIYGKSDRSIEEVVEITEEIDFYYKHTDYQNILRGMRRFNMRHYDYSDGDSEEEYEEEEEIRLKSKHQALQRWIKLNPDNLDMLPLSLRQ
jgi:hypothetical protein